MFRQYVIDDRTGYIILSNINEVEESIDPFDGFATRLQIALELLQQLKADIENYNTPR